jgi:Cdc6-like AAA superfamily ATPase
MSKAIVIVGATGTGKTTEVCKILENLRNRKSFIFDVNKEEKYKVFKNSWDKNLDFKKFVENMCKVANSNIIFEEATIFFSHAGITENIKKILVQKRHTNNFILFNFHSLRQVPLFILDFCDVLIIGKTIDNRKNIETKFSAFTEVFEAFEQAQTDENKFVKIYAKLL